MNCGGDVVVVQRVFATEVAADVTLTAEPASGTLHLAAERHRVIVRIILFNLCADQRRVCRMVVVRMRDLSRSKTHSQIERQPLVG